MGSWGSEGHRGVWPSRPAVGVEGRVAGVAQPGGGGNGAGVGMVMSESNCIHVRSTYKYVAYKLSLDQNHMHSVHFRSEGYRQRIRVSLHVPTVVLNHKHGLAHIRNQTLQQCTTEFTGQWLANLHH